MAAIDVAFERLDPVALVDALVGVVDLLLGDVAPLELGQAGRLVRAHVGPDDAALLRGSVGGGPDLGLEIRFGRLGGHVDAGAA